MMLLVAQGGGSKGAGCGAAAQDAPSWALGTICRRGAQAGASPSAADGPRSHRAAVTRQPPGHGGTALAPSQGRGADNAVGMEQPPDVHFIPI